MKKTFVRDLQPNETITTSFLVQSKELRARKSGEPYLILQLADRTGQIEARKWDEFEDIIDTFDRDDFVKVQGIVQLYRNRPQMNILRLRRIEESEVDIADYLPHTEKDIDEMFSSVLQTITEIKDPHLRQLLGNILADEEIARLLKRAPAAKSLHHATIGGLLEHVTSLLGLARRVAPHYSFIDLDLVITGVLLHDLGKIHELTFDRSFGYSSEGQLLGHMIIALRVLDRHCAAIEGFPPKLKTLIEHLIVSHHGRYEFGSPKLPMFPEALMLHYLDDLDSKLESMRASIAELAPDGGEWTRYNPSLERSLLWKEAYLRPETAATPGGPGETRAQEKGRGEAPATMSLFGERLRTAMEGDSE